jgi:hypothetical protein
MGEKKIAYGLLAGKQEGKRPLGRQRRTRVDNIKMDLVEIEWGDFDLISLVQEWRALVNAVMKLRVP